VPPARQVTVVDEEDDRRPCAERAQSRPHPRRALRSRLRIAVQKDEQLPPAARPGWEEQDLAEVPSEQPAVETERLHANRAGGGSSTSSVGRDRCNREQHRERDKETATHHAGI